MLEALAPATRKQYEKYQNFFHSFMQHFFSLHWFDASPIHVRTFVTFLFKHNKMSLTYIRSFLSGVAYLFKTECVPDPTKEPPVQQILKAYAKVKHQKSTRKHLDIL